MRRHFFAATLLCSILVSFAAAEARSQTADDGLTALQREVACAPPAMLLPPPVDPLLIAGSQDAIPRTVFGINERLVVKGGAKRGVEVGQQYFVRRTTRSGMEFRSSGARGVRTTGWVRIVSVNETTAMAWVEHACGDVMTGDYLVPFEAPTVSADLLRVDTTGTLDFESIGRVVFADEDRMSAGIGDYVMIDRGADQGLASGARFAIYRDLKVGGLPLTPIGEATVATVGSSIAVVRIMQARDAIYGGDYVVPRKQ